LNKRYGYRYTRFGHFGGGWVHARMTFGLKNAEGVSNVARTWKRNTSRAAARGCSSK
jgi:hypothetical protein